VGFCGLGAMGVGMARNILTAGFELTIATSSPEKAERFRGDGASVAETPTELAAQSDIIVTCVPDANALDSLIDSNSGFSAVDLANKLFIECSTIAPHDACRAAERIQAAGGRFIDTPVSGGSKGAAEGTLTIMCGGDAADIETAMPILDAMGKVITHFGPVGAGQAVKAANQLMVAVNMMGAFEAIALVRANGVDPEAMRQALLTGAARSGVLEMHAKRYLDDALSGGFRIELLRKDLGIVALEGGRSGLSQPASALAQQIINAACNAGFEGQDSAVLGKFYDLTNGKARS
jgi:3-hydroxyisobutyrate dehydrogenase-like beta-hydroxyacid dehydrogenase